MLGVTRPLAISVVVRRETRDGAPNLAFLTRTDIDRLGFGMTSGFPLAARDVKLVISSEAAQL